MASTNGFLKYMASPKGRRFAVYGTIATSLTAFGINYFPHTFLLFKHKEIVASYHEGTMREVPETLKKRFEIAVEHLDLVDFDKQYLKPFMVAGFDLYHIGSTKFRFSSQIGIPINYSYTSPKDISKGDVMIRGNPVDWNSNGGKLLEEALVLEEDEQIFGLTREILQVTDNRVLINSLIASGSIVLYYIMSSGLNSKMMLFYKPVSLRVFMYNIVGLFVSGIYFFATDYWAVS